MILIENLMIVFIVTMILGAILMFGLSVEVDGGKVIGVIGGISFFISIAALVALLFYSDSFEAKMRVDIAKREDVIFEQVDVIKELECDEDSDEYKKEINKLRKYIREYNSAVRKYTEEETRPKQFCFYRYYDGKLVTNGTNRDYR